jgi:hypothetical protein
LEPNKNIQGVPGTAKNPMPTADELETAADQAIAACGGDPREAVKSLIVATMETQIEKLKASVSTGYARGRIEMPPIDRKDWYDCPECEITDSGS